MYKSEFMSQINFLRKNLIQKACLCQTVSNIFSGKGSIKPLFVQKVRVGQLIQSFYYHSPRWNEDRIIHSFFCRSVGSGSNARFDLFSIRGWNWKINSIIWFGRFKLSIWSIDLNLSIWPMDLISCPNLQKVDSLTLPVFFTMSSLQLLLPYRTPKKSATVFMIEMIICQSVPGVQVRQISE